MQNLLRVLQCAFKDTPYSKRATQLQINFQACYFDETAVEALLDHNSIMVCCKVATDTNVNVQRQRIMFYNCYFAVPVSMWQHLLRGFPPHFKLDNMCSRYECEESGETR